MRILLIIIALLIAFPAAADQSSAVRLTTLDARVKQAPGDLQTRLTRAELRFAVGMPIEALADLAVVAATAPDSPSMLLIRAEILASLGSPDLALSDLDRRVSTGPPSARAHSLRARLHEEFGHDAGALQDARAALRLGPDPERALTAARLLSTAQGPHAAGGLCVEAADELGGAVTLRLAAVDYFRAAGHPDLALTQVSALLAASPQHPDWLVLSADLLDEAGRPKDAQSRRLRALARLDEALAIRPTPARQAARARLAAQLAELP